MIQAYNGQNATALLTSPRSHNAVGGRIAVPNYKPIPSLSAEQIARFWSYVDRRGIGDCWPWTAAVAASGYGRFYAGRASAGRGNCYRPHRVAYALTYGAIDESLQVDHLCRNRLCVNPAHMELVTLIENSLRAGVEIGLNAVKTHCKYGHEFTPENIYTPPRGGRICRACERRKKSAPRIKVRS
jgi:hypothetical protein